MSLFRPFRVIRRITFAAAVLFAGLHLTHQLGDDPVRSNAHRDNATNSVVSARGVPEGAQAAVVSRNIDGDTIEVFVRSKGPLPQGESVTVRLLEIDTPETKKPDAPVACGGPAAAEFTAGLLPPGTQVALVPDEEGVDQYGRALRYVYTRTQMANVAIARAGYARDLLIAPNDEHISQIRAAVASARSAGRGMWSLCSDPFAPAAG